MVDFTVDIYIRLLNAIRLRGYEFLPFREYMERKVSGFSATGPFVILRHDVDARKENSLNFAKIQHGLGIRGSYYFRVVPQSFDPGIMKRIAEMGHEVGYHYETMDTCRGDAGKAYDEFTRNLENFRKIVSISTICMHGSPRSRYDNKDVWSHYSYRDLEILGEPYFDLDFDSVYYITDTGRRWDGHRVSVRDKMVVPPHFAGLKYRSTDDIIRAIGNGSFPQHVMFTFHPQRWTNHPREWVNELITQNSKNLIKRFFIIK